MQSCLWVLPLRLLPSSLAVGVLVSALPAQTCTTTRVNLGPGGTQAISRCTNPALSADGNWVAFESNASNLVTGDTNNWSDIFVVDLQTGTLVRASVTASGAEANGLSQFASLSADGRYLGFWTVATNLEPPAPNGNAGYMIKDLQTGALEPGSANSSGVMANNSSWGAVTRDGRHFVFLSFATNLVSGDTNAQGDIFERDLNTGITLRVNLGPGGVQDNTEPGVPQASADGRFVAFTSASTQLVAGDTNPSNDVFLADLQSGTIVFADRNVQGVQANGVCSDAGVSDDGRFVCFSSTATNLVMTNTHNHQCVYVKDMQTGAVYLASTDTLQLSGGVQAGFPVLSQTGRFVLFWTGSVLDPQDTNTYMDVYAHDIFTGRTAIVDLGWNGAAGDTSVWQLFGVNRDGTKVAFSSDATNAVPGDTNTHEDVFVRDCAWDQPHGIFCPGTALNCPCGNGGSFPNGCANSAHASGANLAPSGGINPDTIVLAGSGMPATVSAIFLQGSADVSQGTQWGGIVFGDGNRCVGTNLKRLALKTCVAGAAQFPQAGDPSISARSAALGDVLVPGSVRYYQTYYRDPDPAFCSFPVGNTWNVTNGAIVVW